MKLNFNLNTHFIEGLIADLREKRLWPVAAALVVALVAVPILLSSGGSSSVPVAAAPPVAAPSGAVPALPAVSVTATPSHGRLTGKRRDPFTQQVKSKSTTAQTATSKTSSKAKSSAGSSSTTKKSTASTTSGAVGGSTTTVTSTPTSTTTPAQPPPTGLTASQAYHVAISMTVATGDVHAVDPLQRLSLLPSDQEPRLIELGVQNGGHRVLFVVQPGTIVRGPGRCTPGPIDCEIVSLAPNQVEWVGTSGPSGIAGVALMAVTAINAADYSSPAAADKARSATSAAGRRALSASTLRALSLFQFKPGLDALVDLSNVTVGGN
ncbi:MAG TPA: hypothetical protein VG294_03475 [Solirubrobacteraceae bacterium]|jgi:hypothetical protein|nr:hypothetical protein [Solirubrobacteraceae bacterium]